MANLGAKCRSGIGRIHSCGPSNRSNYRLSFLKKLYYSTSVVYFTMEVFSMDNQNTGGDKKPAHNRLTYERIKLECESKGHTLLSYDYPWLGVKCHCGHEYKQKLHPYRAAKNSCKKCDSARKSKPRPEHSEVMKGDNNPSKRPEVREKISENTRGPRPHLVGTKKNWKPGVLDARSKWMRDMRANGTIISRGNPNGSWAPSPEQRYLPGVLYFVRYLDESGIHFKIGITRKSVSRRFKPRQLISILHLHHATLGECYDFEQSLLRWAKKNNYRYSSPTTTELIKPEAYSEILSRLKQASILAEKNSSLTSP